MTATPLDFHSIERDWHAAAESLTDWALARVFIRTDRFGGYYAKDGETKKTARPNKGCKAPFDRKVVVKHFRADRTEDVIGAYCLTSGEQGTGRWLVIDIDAHDDRADKSRNRDYSRHLYAKLRGLGFRPLLLSWATGGYHLWVFFNTDVDGPKLNAFGNWLVSDARVEPWSFESIESFPKQPTVKHFGNWVRLVGRHHTKESWAAVFDGERMLHGQEAVNMVLACTGDDPALIPAEAKPQPKTNPSPRMPTTPKPHGDDVFIEFNRRTSIDTVVEWHEAQGHRVTNRGAHRVDFTRAGKDGTGQSFNVMERDGCAVTYSFSTNAGMPPQRGLTPAQVRCYYESGSCDKPAMARFAEKLRDELGMPRRRNAVATLAGNGEPATAKQPAERFTDTDLANASRFVADHGKNVLFVADWNRWCCWDGRRWAVDRSGNIVAGLAHETLRKMANEAIDKMVVAMKGIMDAGDDEAAIEKAKKEKQAAERELAWAKKSQDVKRVRAMIEMAEPYLLVPEGGAVFDTHPHLLNCPNGTVDLRTAEMRPHAQSDYLTRLCPTNFNPEATATTYAAFLKQVLPNDDVANYVRELSGYACTGEVTDQSIHLLDGPGSNGKTVILELWTSVLGEEEYATTAPAELIADFGENRHPTEKTVLRGARLAVCQETGDEEKLNAKRVKLLTGGSRIKARGMRQDYYSFTPTHKLVVATNHLPRVRVNDHAIWRRIRVIRFGVVFWTEADQKAKPEGDYPEHRRADPSLPERLLAEREGILADMVAHAAAFYGNNRRLIPPAAVMKSVVEYRTAEDVTTQFLEGWKSSLDARVKAGDFYGRFLAWYKSEIDPDGKDVPGPRAFGMAATAKFGSKNVCGRAVYAVSPATAPLATPVGDVGDEHKNRVNLSRARACLEAKHKNRAHPPHPPLGPDDPNMPLSHLERGA